MAERVGCAVISHGAQEDLAGTASTVRRWLLIEQPGPWGADAVRESRLDPHVAAHLVAVARDLRLRVLLIRRHDPARTVGRRSAFAAFTTGRSRWLERLTFDDPAELAERDWSPLAEGASVGGERLPGPLFLVCTNGRHDPCCAEFGRPLATALSTVEPEATWECSHFGGDRFAGNVVSLPDGLYYGRVAATEAASLARATRERKVSLPHFRGRSSLPFAAQAAEIAVRQRTGLVGIDDLAPIERRRLEPGQLAVTFRDVEGAEHEVTVTVRHEDPARMLSCGAEPAVPPRYDTTVPERPPPADPPGPGV